MQLGNRNSQHSFAQIPDVNIPRSSFDRSFTIKDTINFDELVPIFCDEILPGDTCNVTVNSFARLATQIVPIMDNMYLDFFFFFVPNRLTWDNWEKFNGAQTDPGDSTDFLVPKLQVSSDLAIGSLYDHFGIPTGVQGFEVNSLPFRAYSLIWNEWFRDQNMQDSVVVPKDDGPDVISDFSVLKRGKRHDYFTSSLPWPQKGPSVTVPIGTVAPVISDGTNPKITGSTLTNAAMTINGGTNQLFANGAGIAASTPATWGNNTGLVTDLTDATAATINQLREAFLMQSLFELDARGGTRYVEILRAHFGVTSPDFRLQRPEYLGGGSTTINSHPVAQTSQTDPGSPQANLASFATASTGSRDGIGFSKSFVEHGYVIGLVCARADITYQQGLNRMWSRSTRYDFFWPKLQQLGEQAVLNKEIFISEDPNIDDSVFGYQERYAEYRYKPSEIRGQFRSTSPTPLDQWHLAQEFGSLPTLNSAFIQQSTPIERAIAVDSEPDLLFDCYFRYRHARPMMSYSVPATLGRF